MYFVFQIFSNDGQFKSRFGIRGRSPGQLQRPTGVAVHPSGDIIIADYDNKWVSIFSSDGKFKVRLTTTDPFPSPGDLPDPGIKPISPVLQAASLPL